MNEENDIKPPDEETELPLKEGAVPVARFNRKIVGLIVGAVFTVAAVSMIVSLAPAKKKTQAELAADQMKAAQQNPINMGAPVLPDGINNAPANYGTAANNRGMQQGVPQLGPPLAGDLGAAQQKANATYTTYPVGAGAGGGDPGYQSQQQQAEQAALDQRRQEIMAVRRSSLTFGQNGQPASAGSKPGMPADFPKSPSMQMPNFDLGKMGLGAQKEFDQNQQDDKNEFIKSNTKTSPILTATFMKPVSPYEVKAGSIIPAVFITGVNSDLPGQVKAQIRENVYDSVTGQHLLLPQGTVLIGEYDSKVTYGQERVLLVWSRLILPNGWSINLEGMPGVDMSGYAGVKDRVNNHYTKIITGVVLGSVLGAGAQVATGGQGSPNTPASFGQLAVSGAAQNVNSAGQAITQKNLNIQPTIEIRQGLRVNIFVTKDLILKPYRRG